MSRVRISADVEREDRVLLGLTARQLAILAAPAALAWLLFTATSRVLPLPVAAGLVVPIILAGAALALGRRDGLPLDRLALAGLRQARTPRRQVPAPEGVPSMSDWLHSAAEPLPAALSLPARDIDADGVISLGGEGAVLVCRATTVNFALRTPAEQEALVAVFARFLHALTGPVQVLARAERVDLRARIAELADNACGLPHPALEAAAREHAGFLAELTARRDVLRRELLVCFRDPDPHGAAVRLQLAADQAAALLSQAGITLAPLDAEEAAAALARALDPERPPPPPGLTPPGRAVTRSCPC